MVLFSKQELKSMSLEVVWLLSKGTDSELLVASVNTKYVFFLNKMYCTSYVYYIKSSSIICLMLCDISGEKKKKKAKLFGLSSSCSYVIRWLKQVLHLLFALVRECLTEMMALKGFITTAFKTDREVGLNLCTDFTFLQPFCSKVFFCCQQLQEQSSVVWFLVFGSHKPPRERAKGNLVPEWAAKVLHVRAKYDFLPFNFLLLHLKTFLYGLALISSGSRL